MILRQFGYPFRLLSPQILMPYFKIIPSVDTSANKTAPKSNRFLKHQQMFQSTIGSKGFRHVADVCSCAQSATAKKKIACTKTVYEIDHAETSSWISSISFTSNFKNAGRFFDHD